MARKRGDADATDPREARHKDLATRPPALTVLTDHALAADQGWRDDFDLAFHLGPVFDILRHPQTRLPLSVAIYGDWGAGKTTAMCWLEGLLDTWRDEVAAGRAGDGAIAVHTLWFHPWRYQSKDDVWKGLIAEVILSAVTIRGLDDDVARKLWLGARQFGAFLGRGFTAALGALTVDATVGGGLVSGAGIGKAVQAEWDAAASPEAPFLNTFETALRQWLSEAVGPDERLVVFIDDLDRCLPGVALEVLEALKLYLDIPRLIFVVGVDRAVIDAVVTRHYDELGLGLNKAREYLAKMFQVEVNLAPTEPQIERFLLDQLAQVDAFRGLPQPIARMFQGVILRLALRNPREVKRLINSALMRGLGASTMAAESGGAYTFAQGLQLFFVHRVLADRHQQGELVGQARGDRFFGAWSRLRRAHPDAPATVEVGPDGPGAVHPAYRLVEGEGLAELWPLLADEDLGALMTVDYPADTRILGRAMAGGSDDSLVFAAAARWLDVDVGQVGQGDLARVQQLNLAFTRLRSLVPVAGCAALRVLVLSRAPVAELSPLVGLSRLERLLVDDTRVRDLGSLAGLTSLVALKVDGTRVADLGPLAGLERLRELGIGDTAVADLGPLAGLARLKVLNAFKTQVSDLSPLRELAGLSFLNVAGSPVRDLTPLAGLSALDNLAISDTQVADLSPLSGLTALRVVDLTRTPVKHLQALHGLPHLVQVSVGGCPLDAGEVDALRAARPGVNIVGG